MCLLIALLPIRRHYYLEGVSAVETHDRDEQGIVSLAEVCHNILSDPERMYGSSSHAQRSKNRKINERRYFVCPEGVSSGEGLKYVCHRFGKDDGIRSNYHLRANPELVEADHRPNVIAMRRFPCFCTSCVSKMVEPIETRYTG